jgi:hypothetical protein
MPRLSALHLVLTVAALGGCFAECILNADCRRPDAVEVCGVCSGQRFYADGGCHQGSAVCLEFQCIESCAAGGR